MKPTYSPWVKDVPCWFGGQKVKVMGHESGFRTMFDYAIHLWSWNFMNTFAPIVKDVPYCFWGQKVKVMGHLWLKMVSGP